MRLDLGDVGDAALRARWLDLTRRELPAIAPTRPDWPIRLDHCFARVILDAVCGRVWYEALQRPAYRSMTAEQLRAAIALGEDVAAGRADLARLNERSLQMRGKRPMANAGDVS